MEHARTFDFVGIPGVSVDEYQYVYIHLQMYLRTMCVRSLKTLSLSPRHD